LKLARRCIVTGSRLFTTSVHSFGRGAVIVARSIERNVDLLLSILPFEKDWYADRGIDQVEFVGHPLAGEVHALRIARSFAGQ